MVQAVEHEAVVDAGWFGFGTVTEINQSANPNGADDGYTSYYAGYLNVNQAGTWHFRTTSDETSEIEIDGVVVASIYSETSASSGSIYLDAGWHHIVYRHQEIDGDGQLALLEYATPEASTEWWTLSTASLTLKALPFETGLLLVTRRNTCETDAADHAALVDCVESTSLVEDGWYGAGTVTGIDQAVNIHAADATYNDNYTSHYEGYFYVDSTTDPSQVGTWTFQTESDGGSEIEVDGAVVAGVYGGAGTDSGAIDLAAGWHHLVYRHQEIDGDQLASATFMTPGDAEWRSVNSTEIPSLQSYAADRDWDGLPDAVEAALETDPERADSDMDELGDLYEVANDLDPLNPDSNGDDLIDYLEVAHGGTLDAAVDLDDDGVANVWDDDNDNDGVPDGLDPSPFSRTGSTSNIHLDIQYDGNPTYVDFQLRPSIASHLDLPERIWDWPEDYDGQMQDIDMTEEDVHLVPMLEIDASQFPIASETEDYGMVQVNSFSPTEWTPQIKVSGTGDKTAGGGAAFANLNDNAIPDLLLMAVDDPDGENQFRYRIGWDVGADGQAASWSSQFEIGGTGAEADGGGATFAFINDNDIPDLVLMAVDNPAESNSFRYRIGWDVGANGEASSWSNHIQIGGLGHHNDGGGIDIDDIDGNDIPDLVLMGIDSPGGSNNFWYKVGWNLGSNGQTESWSTVTQIAGIGAETEGGGISLVDINRNGKLDLLLMGVDAPSGANAFRYKVGWDLDNSGQPSSWSDQVEMQGLDYSNDGGGATITDIDGDGLLDMLLMGLDDAAGRNNFFYKVGWDLENKLLVPLASVKDEYDTTVALSGRLFYPPSDLESLSLDARLIWMVRAETELFGQAPFSEIKSSAAMFGTEEDSGTFGGSTVKTTLEMNQPAGGTAMGFLGGDPDRPDLLVSSICQRTTEELNDDEVVLTHCYRIGWDLDAEGNASSWSDIQWWPGALDHAMGMLPSFHGGDAAIADVDGNGYQDVILIGVDYRNAYEGCYFYVVGYDIQSDGSVDHWGTDYGGDYGFCEGAFGMEDNPFGAGVAVADIDGNETQDLILMHLAYTSSGDTWWKYRIGWDLGANGLPARWSDVIQSPSDVPIGLDGMGGGADLADLDDNGMFDLILTRVGGSSYNPELYYYIAWDLDATSGEARHWTQPRPVRQDLLNKYEKTYGARGGGAAVGDIDGNDIPDVIAAATYQPENPNYKVIKYAVGWDLGSKSTTTLARYPDNFYLTSLKVEENYGSNLALFYSSDKEETTNAAAVLRYEFLNSSNPLSDAPGILEGNNVSVSHDYVEYAHQDEALQGAAGLTEQALDTLPDDQELPIAFAIEDQSASVWLDEVVGDNYVLGSSLSFDVTAEEVVTAKTLKMNWYDTAEDKPLDIEEIVAMVEGWADYDAMEREQTLKLLLLWDMGEIEITSVGDRDISFDRTEGQFILLKIRGGFGGLKALSLAPGLILGAYTFLKTWAGAASLAQAGKATATFYKVVRGVTVAPGSLASAESILGKSLSQSKWLTRISRLARFCYVIGIVIGVGMAIWAFVEIGRQYNWSSRGTAAAAIYASLYLGYLVLLEMIALIPVVGVALMVLVILSDVITWFITGSSWSDKLISWIMDSYMTVEVITTLDLDVMETRFYLQDEHNNGPTEYDDFNIIMRVRERVDVEEGENTYSHTYASAAYVRPKVTILRLADHQYSQWGRDDVPTDIHTASVDQPYRITDWYLTSYLEPHDGINVPIEIEFETTYRTYWYDDGYDDHYRSESGTKTYTIGKLYFDVLPDTLEDTWREEGFLNWLSTAKEPPTAEAKGPYTVPEGGSVQLDGTASAGTSGELTYSWDTDGDGDYELSGSTPTFDASGLDGPAEIEVVLRVCDEIYQDNCSIDQATVTVENVAPEATATGDSIDENEIATVSGTISDPGKADTFTVLIDWGEGEPQSYSYAAGTTSYTEAHTYLDDNPTGTASDSYTIGVTVTDDDDGEDTATTTVTVDNVAPAVTAVGSTIDENGEATVSGTITDLGTQDDFTVTIDWGEGVPQSYSYDAGTTSYEVTHQYLDDNPTDTAYDDYTTSVTVTDDDGGVGTASTKVTVNNVAPAVTAAGSIIYENGIATVSGTITDPGAKDTFTVLIDWGEGSPQSYSYPAGTISYQETHQYLDDDPSGTPSDDYAIVVTVTDDDSGVGTASAVVTVNNLAPAVTVDPETQTCQYSDELCEVTFTATDVAADTLMAATTPDPLPDSLMLADKVCTVPDDGLWQTCTWTITGTMDEQMGDYDIKVAVSDDDTGSGSATTTITVAPEDANIWLDDYNAISVQVDSPGGDSPLFSLIAYVQETVPDAAECGANPGDIHNAQVAMTLMPVGPGSPVEGTCTRTDGNDETGYAEIATFTCVFSGVDVNTYEVQATVTGGYYIGGPAEDVLVVYDPSLGFTTGGGWFYWPGTDDKTNFGYTMKYNKNGTNVQGSLLLIRHLADGTIYRVKSNALYGLALGDGEGFGWATFSGKSTYMEPDWPDPIGNHEFLVYVEDGDEPGTDRFWIEVINGALALPREAPEQAETLVSGNIVVPHNPD
jgi:hypothetical protein